MRKGGIMNKCKVKTKVYILEWQCFYATIKLIFLFYQIVCQKQILILLCVSQFFLSNEYFILRSEIFVHNISILLYIFL